jgi:hypothetical protein
LFRPFSKRKRHPGWRTYGTKLDKCSLRARRGLYVPDAGAFDALPRRRHSTAIRSRADPSRSTRSVAATVASAQPKRQPTGCTHSARFSQRRPASKFFGSTGPRGKGHRLVSNPLKACGTEGSNPLSSSGESANHPSLSGGRGKRPAPDTGRDLCSRPIASRRGPTVVIPGLSLLSSLGTRR